MCRIASQSHETLTSLPSSHPIPTPTRTNTSGILRDIPTVPDGPGLVAYGPIIDIVLHNAAVKSSGLGLTKRMRVLEFETARVKGQADTLSVAGKTMGKTGTAMAGAAAGAGALGKAAVGKSGARDAAGREQEQVRPHVPYPASPACTLTVPPLPHTHTHTLTHTHTHPHTHPHVHHRNRYRDTPDASRRRTRG